MIEITIILLGLSIGSFINVCILRLPAKQSLIIPRSHCTNCGSCLGLIDLIPIVSYLILKGRCRYCAGKIAPRYIFIETLTGILFLLLFQMQGLTLMLFFSFLFTAFLITITFIDIDHQLILDKVLIWFAGTGVITNVLIGYLVIWDILLGALAGGSLLLIIAVITRGGIGGGDIKFAAALGLWLGFKLTLLTIFLSFIIGGIVGALLLLLKLKGRKDFIPFGPFIAVAAFISFLYGHDIINWYFQYMTR